MNKPTYTQEQEDRIRANSTRFYMVETILKDKIAKCQEWQQSCPKDGIKALTYQEYFSRVEYELQLILDSLQAE